MTSQNEFDEEEDDEMEDFSDPVEDDFIDEDSSDEEEFVEEDFGDDEDFDDEFEDISDNDDFDVEDQYDEREKFPVDPYYLKDYLKEDEEDDEDALLNRIDVLERRLQDLENMTRKQESREDFHYVSSTSPKRDVSRSSSLEKRLQDLEKKATKKKDKRGKAKGYLIDLLQSLRKELAGDPDDAGSVLCEIKEFSRQLHVSESENQDRDNHQDWNPLLQANGARSHFYPSNDVGIRANRKKYPPDCYSFVALNGPQRGKIWSQRSLYFVFGLLPFVFQMLLLGLLAFGNTNHLYGTLGEIDNPDQGKGGIMAFFADFTPANSTPIVRWAQVVSLAAYAIYPGSSLKDIVRAIQLFPQSSSIREANHPIGYLRLSCILRLSQGITALAVILLLVMTSDTVFDIILNFVVVNLISCLGDNAFFLAITGELSPALKTEAQRIAKTELPRCIYKKKESKWKCYKWMTGLTYVFLFGMVAFVFAVQDSNKYWTTDILRVQFREETGLNQYSGCFEVNSTSSSVQFSRRTYHSFDNSSLTFGYCRDDRQWFLFKGDASDACDASKNDATLLARSSKTDTFDIATSFDGPWVSTSNTPLDLYFFDNTDEKEIRDHCDLSLGDGKCDPFFNEYGYDFDGGDCCAATCTKSNCGKGGLTGVFGSDVSGDGYRDCKDPKMFPITIQLNDIASSRDPKFTGWRSFEDVDFDARPGGYEEDGFLDWMKAVPEKPYFSLDCNGKNVMTAYIDESMVNRNETILVEDGATCTLFVRNSTSTDGDIYFDEPIWYVDYKIFHGGVRTSEGVEILTGHSYEAEAVNFSRIPECYFIKKLRNHQIDIESMYETFGESRISDKSISALRSRCEDTHVLEKDATTLIPTDMPSPDIIL